MTTPQNPSQVIAPSDSNPAGSLNQTLPRGRRVHLWTQTDSARAAQLWQDRFTDYHGEDFDLPHLTAARYRVLHLIATDLNRSYLVVKYRLDICGPSFGACQRSTRHASAREIADAAARMEARNHQSLTGARFGDPPPGWSALDKRNAERRTA